MKFIITILFLFVAVVHAQIPPSTWYFGRFAGIEFSEDKDMYPSSINDGKINTKEGCAIVNNECGEVIFYTDGNTVWNAAHEVKVEGLNGNFTSTTSAVITSVPKKPQRYYVFTVDAQCGNDGLCVTTLDLSSGDIEVVEKNKLIRQSVAEKIEIIEHENGIDFWLMVMRCDGALNAFLVDEEGIADMPIESDGGFDFVSEFNSIGQMKSNIIGNVFAASINALDRVMVYNFDKSDGRATIRNELIARDFRNAYGLEFSPNGRYLYIGTTLNEEFDIPSSLFQLDLNYETDREIIDNRFLLTSSMSERISQLQLGPDGRIYVSVFDEPFLSLIDNPNENQNDCNYRPDLIDLTPNRCKLGLPNIPKMQYKKETEKVTISVCEDAGVTLGPPFYPEAEYQWSGKAGNKTTRTILLEDLSDEDEGLYIIDITHACFEKRIEYTLDVRDSPVFDIKGNLAICEGQTTKLWIERKRDVSFPIEWSTGETSDTIYVDEPGIYSALSHLGLNLCSHKDSVEVKYKDADFEIFGNRTLCADEFTQLTIVANEDIYDFEWNTGETTQTIKINSPGEYWVFVNQNGECLGKASATVKESDVEKPMLNVSDNEKICSGNSILVEVLNYDENLDYYWEDGFKGHIREINSSGEFKIFAESKESCIDSTSFSLEFLEEINIEIVGELTFCEGSQTSLRVDNVKEEYNIVWSTGKNARSLVITDEGEYWVSVETDAGCIVRDTVFVTMIPAIVLNPNFEGIVEICESEQIEFDLEEIQDNVDYYWADGVTEINRILNHKGEYILYAENYPCKDSILVQLIVHPIPEVSLIASKEALTCGLDSLTLSVENPKSNIEYSWSTGEIGNSITVSEPNVYTLYAKSQYGCVDSLEYEVIENSVDLNLNIEGSTILCQGESVTLEANRNYAKYEWTNGETSKSITVTEPGIYGLLVQNEYGCEAYDEVEITEYSVDVTIQKEVLFDEICSGETSGRTVQITNNSKNQIVLSSFEIDIPDVFTIQGLPITIDPETVQNLHFTYSPDYPINHSTSGKLIFEEPCYSEYDINLVGSAYNEIELSLSPIEGSPGDEVCTQATINNVCGNDFVLENGFTVEFEIEYPRNLLYLHEVSKPWVVQSYMPNMILQNTENIDLKQNDIFELCGILLLDTELNGSFKLLSDNWTYYNIRTKMSLDFGEINVDEVCAAEHRTVSFREIDFVSVNTKENKGNAELTIASSISGNFDIDIYNYYGNKIYSETKTLQNDKYTHNTFNLNKDFHSGVYFVIVKSPNEVLEAKFIITR